MTNRIDRRFRELRARRQKAFIAYITAGDPDIKTTEALVLALERAGVDIIELGIPFSDPLADGPTIQAASQRALRKKTSLRKVFAAAGRLRRVTGIPLVFMMYYNPLLRYGAKAFFRSCRSFGVDGVIVPDLPCEEADGIIKEARANGVATIFLVAPTSTRSRIAVIAKKSRGFIYYVSLTGVTGARKELPGDVVSKIRLIKSVTDRPVAVGFGIANANQASRIAKVADGVIVGSALVRIIERKGKVVKRVESFAKSLARAVHGV